MPDIRDISIGSRYVGDSSLGGGSFGVARIDTKPFDMFAAYSFAYNQKMWEQKQKELELQAKESAEFAAYDLTNAIPKYAKHLRDKFAETLAWSQNNRDVKNYYKNPKGYDEWKKRLNELDNDIKDGATQEIIAAAAKKEIEAAKTPEEKAELQRQLDEEIAAKDIRTPLTIHKYNAVPSKIPEIPIKTFDFTKRGANGLIAQRKFKAPDQGFIVSQAFLNANNMQGETGEDFSNMPEDVRKLKIKEAKMRKATGRNAEVDQAIIITEALRDKSLRDENGKIDLKKVAASSNPIISGLIEGMIRYNQIMDEELALIDQGAYSDNLGVLIPGVKGMKRNDYKKIDFSDGEITAYDLLLVKYRANAPATTWETETKELNNDIQRMNAETARINANKSGSGADGKPIPVLDKPADFIDQHVRTLKTLFKKTGGKNVTIEYGNVDAKTRLAIGLKAGETVTFWNDGDFIIHTPAGTDADGTATDKQTRRKGTIENVVQGFIEAVKTTDLASEDKDGTMAQGFQQNSEARLRQRWGSSSGKDIWNSPQWDNPDAAPNDNSGTVELSGKIDVSTLKTGQSYSVNGKTYIWNGSKLKPK